MATPTPALTPTPTSTPKPTPTPGDGAPRGRPVRVYVDGVFDLFHAGHVAFLRKARATGGDNVVLLVGVITDEDAKWKRPPIMSHEERVEMVGVCREVDFVIVQAPLVITDRFLDKNQIDLVVHGDDDRQEKFFAAAIARGIMRYVPYTSGVSTSKIIDRIAAGVAEKFSDWIAGGAASRRET